MSGVFLGMLAPLCTISPFLLFVFQFEAQPTLPLIPKVSVRKPHPKARVYYHYRVLFLTNRAQNHIPSLINFLLNLLLYDQQH